MREGAPAHPRARAYTPARACAHTPAQTRTPALGAHGGTQPAPQAALRPHACASLYSLFFLKKMEVVA